MPQAIDLLFATPRIRPRFPAISPAVSGMKVLIVPVNRPAASYGTGFGGPQGGLPGRLDFAEQRESRPLVRGFTATSAASNEANVIAIVPIVRRLAPAKTFVRIATSEPTHG